MNLLDGLQKRVDSRVDEKLQSEYAKLEIGHKDVDRWLTYMGILVTIFGILVAYQIFTFIQKAKDAGLQLSEIQELLQLQLEDREQVRHVIQQRLDKIDQRIQELNSFKKRLSTWLDECKTSNESGCPILKELKNR